MSDLNKDQPEPDVKGKEKVVLDAGPTPKLRGKRAAGLKAAKAEPEKEEEVSPALPSQEEIQVLRAAVDDLVSTAQPVPPKVRKQKPPAKHISSPKPQPAFLLSEHPELLASDDGTGEMLMYAGLGLTAAGVACLLLSGKLI